MTTIAGIAAGDSNFSILVSAIQFIDAEKGTNYLGVLSDPTQSLTVFAPTNAAFGQLAADLGFAGDVTDTDAVTAFLTTLGADTLETVVTYHVSPGTQLAADIAAAGTVSTLQGGTIDAGELPTLGDAEPDLIDPSLVATDITADNGVVHVIDRVLLPIDLPDNDAASITGLVLNTSGATGFDANPDDFDLLRESVIAADLAAALDDSAADLTVFAPTDGAFVGLSQTLGYDGTDEAGAFSYLVDALRLLNGGNDPVELLTTVLTYHVSGQSLQASQVLASATIPTLQGGELTVDAGSLTLGDAEPDLADPALVATDIQASNGIVHVIDGVLLPADLLQSDGSGDVDFVIGDDGFDLIRTGLDNDLVDGKGGHDLISAGAGNDLVLGGDGGDTILGGSGDDTLKGEAGRDIISARWGNDVVSGGDDNDNIYGGSGHDDLSGDGGNDFISGGSGHDSVDGGMGDDLLHGGSGNDIITGGDGDDFITGARGHDVIEGGAGNDTLFGGWGVDTFVFGAGDGHDVILGFRPGQDKIDLSAFDLTTGELQDAIHPRLFRTEIDLGNTEITLLGTWAFQLDADDFIL